MTKIRTKTPKRQNKQIYFHFVGYCLLPVIGLAGLSILVNLKGLLGVIFASITIAWSTFAAARSVCVCVCVCVCWGGGFSVTLMGFSIALMVFMN
jgi:hypothetical protein